MKKIILVLAFSALFSLQTGFQGMAVYESKPAR
jgi:hypothetical protein